MKLSKRITIETEFSKVLSLILFMVIPFLFLFLGYDYGITEGKVQQMRLDDIRMKNTGLKTVVEERTSIMQKGASPSPEISGVMKKDTMMQKESTPSVMVSPRKPQ